MTIKCKVLISQQKKNLEKNLCTMKFKIHPATKIKFVFKKILTPATSERKFLLSLRLLYIPHSCCGTASNNAGKVLHPLQVFLAFHTFLEWHPCHSPAMVFCSSLAIYLGLFRCPLWGKLVFLSPISNCFKIELGMAQLYNLTFLGGICFLRSWERLVNHFLGWSWEGGRV